jgi:Fe-S-cluster-containing hydrogenase component 2
MVCPTNAIYEGAAHFMVDAKKCTECEGDYADSQCASICPIEGAILNGAKQVANPAGSLTGIPPQLLQAALAEIQAR